MGALEMAYQGPTLAVEAESVRVAYAGGTAAIDIDVYENPNEYFGVAGRGNLPMPTAGAPF